LAIEGYDKEYLRVDASGNVGIGTSSPSGALHVSRSGLEAGITLERTTSATAKFTMAANDGNLVFTDQNQSAERLRIDALGGITGTSQAGGHVVFNSNTTDSDFRVAWNSGTHALYVDGATGNVGIGEADPDSTLTVKGASHTNFQVKSNSESTKGFIQTVQDSDVRIGSSTNHPVSFYQNGTERMRIDSSGNLLVGTTTTGPGAQSGVAIAGGATSSDVYIRHANGTSSGAVYAAFIYNTSQIGSITQNGTSAVAYNTSSDQRLKENIADAPSASDDIDAIQVRSFDWKADGSHQKYGMVAQELQSVAPEAVSGDADSEEMMGVDYSKLVPMLVKEIQSLRTRVAQLENN
jgi:hypothetical protein